MARRSRKYHDDDLDLSELPPLARLILLIIFVVGLFWALKGVSPWKEWIQSVINIVIFAAKIGLIVIGVGIVIYVAYKVYDWRLDKKIEEEMKQEVEEMRAKGYVRYLNAKGELVWGTPEEAEKHNYLAEIVRAIEDFKPPKRYENEEGYHHTLFAYLKAKYPQAELEKQIGSSRPDIVIDNVAIEVKGPTGSRELDSIPSKILRYPQHFEHVIIVLFDVRSNPRYFAEWYEGISRKFPEAIVIKKDV